LAKKGPWIRLGVILAGVANTLFWNVLKVIAAVETERIREKRNPDEPIPPPHEELVLATGYDIFSTVFWGLFGEYLPKLPDWFKIPVPKKLQIPLEYAGTYFLSGAVTDGICVPVFALMSQYWTAPPRGKLQARPLWWMFEGKVHTVEEEGYEASGMYQRLQ